MGKSMRAQVVLACFISLAVLAAVEAMPLELEQETLLETSVQGPEEALKAEEAAKRAQIEAQSAEKNAEATKAAEQKTRENAQIAKKEAEGARQAREKAQAAAKKAKELGDKIEAISKEAADLGETMKCSCKSQRILRRPQQEQQDAQRSNFALQRRRPVMLPSSHGKLRRTQGVLLRRRSVLMKQDCKQSSSLRRLPPWQPRLNSSTQMQTALPQNPLRSCRNRRMRAV